MTRANPTQLSLLLELRAKLKGRVLRWKRNNTSCDASRIKTTSTICVDAYSKIKNLHSNFKESIV